VQIPFFWFRVRQVQVLFDCLLKLGKAFFKFLVSLASFLMLCAMLALSSSLAAAAFVQLDDGCPFLPQLKHVLSFQYSLSKVIVPWLCRLCHLYHPFEWMTILQMKSFVPLEVMHSWVL
jgi:hypothetical protein